MAAKQTATLIPLCHPLPLTKVAVTFTAHADYNTIAIEVQAETVGRTGVEMEALTAAVAGALTIYDMMKWLDKEMVIGEVKLLYKSGGKSGLFERKE